MNYLGHAHLAELEHPDPAFILGAMLPDLEGLAQVRSPRPPDGLVGLGVAFHHESDRVFHGCAEFRAEQARLTGLWATQGIRKGPARALAHIGVEFLLDAGLAERAQGYFKALEAGACSGSIFGHFPMADQAKLKGLCGYLLGRGREPFCLEPVQFATRLARTLEGRSRLAPTSEELGLATGELLAVSEAWMVKAHHLSLAILTEVRAGSWQKATGTGTLDTTYEIATDGATTDHRRAGNRLK